MIAKVIQMLLAQPLLLFALLALLLSILARARIWVPVPANNALPLIAVIGLAAAVTIHLGFAFAYLASPIYLDHVEPNAAVVSYLFNQGLPVYHELDAAPRYSMLYGPAQYIFNGFSYRLFGDSDTAFKLTGVTCLFVSYFFIGWSVIRLDNAQKRDVLIALGIFAVLALFFRNYSFWSKSDSIMTAFVSLGVFSCFCRRPMLGAALCGIGLGIAVNGKLPGFAYFLPLVALHFQKDGWRSLFTIGAVSLIVALAPYFLFNNVSLLNYLALLQSAGEHGLSPALFMQNAAFGLFFVVPLLSIAAFTSKSGEHTGWLKDNWLVVIAAAAALLLIVTVGSKPGSGPYHLLPFLPATAVLSIAALKRAQRQGGTFPSAAPWFWVPFSSFAMAAFIKGLYSAYFGVALVTNLEKPRLVIDDIQQILAANPNKNIHMGYGDGSRYARTFFRTQLVYAGEPYLLDAAALMDFEFSGIPIPEATFAAMNEDKDAIWLIPRDQQPFTGKAWLRRFDPEGYLFGAGFRQNFRDRFVLVDQTEFYQIWAPK